MASRVARPSSRRRPSPRPASRVGDSARSPAPAATRSRASARRSGTRRQATSLDVRHIIAPLS
eukprot:7866237-Pyramimonas_sp.AAC.1